MSANISGTKHALLHRNMGTFEGDVEKWMVKNIANGY